RRAAPVTSATGACPARVWLAPIGGSRDAAMLRIMSTLPPPDDSALAHSAQLQRHIREQVVAAGGPIPFSRFMELCLYAPGLGYYSAGASKFGEAGDFVTAPELGPLFAACTADAIAPVIRQLGPEAQIVELGGGSGAF